MFKILIGIIVLAVLAFAWWTISPLFIVKEVQDELPEAVRESVESNPATSTSAATTTNTEAAAASEAETNATTEPTTDASSNIDARFPILDTPRHPASGEVRVIATPEEQIIRFENYDGTNGPDLKIYLANDLEATDYVSLGDARGNKGNINYGVPLDIDISEYTYVLTWCEAFGELFDYAEIN